MAGRERLVVPVIVGEMYGACLLLTVLSEDIKQVKQLFVSGLAGTTLTEVTLLGCVLPVCYHGTHALLRLVRTHCAAILAH